MVRGQPLRYMAAGICIVATLCGCLSPGRRREELQHASASLYESLLSMYPEDAQGRGEDAHFLGAAPEHQPMTYGLLLSSEAARLRVAGSDESRRRVRKAMEWIVENADLDRDGKPGWGLPQAWDAFGDGSLNPVNHPYTITTAIVLAGTLDALAVPSLWSTADDESITRLAVDVVLRWCREAWSHGHGGGFFWYSPSPDDAIFAVNTPAMFLGCMTRLLRERSAALSDAERRLIEDRADALARAIVATVTLRDGAPFWDYMAWPNIRNLRRPNDLVHHVYTLLGIESYRSTRSRVRLPWSRYGALLSLDAFWADGQIRQYPQNTQYEGSRAKLKNQPAILWGAGALLAGYARLGDRGGVKRSLTAVERDYGPFPSLTLYPDGIGASGAFYPRQAAHVLWGLALSAYDPALYGRSDSRTPILADPP